MPWAAEEWKAVGNVLSGLGSIVSSLFTAAGVLAAAWYFVFRKWRGYFVTNLSLSIDSERSPSDDPAIDVVCIRVALKKLDRGLLQ